MADVAIKSNAYAEQTDTSLVLVSHLSANQLGTFNFGQSNYFKNALPRVRPIRTWRLRIGAFTGRRGNRLKLVKQIAELHGGRAIATSDGPDHGATFTVTLSKISTENLEVWLQLGRDAMAGKKRMIVTHSEIFPGTFASTTETADYLLQQLGVPRTAVLKWGPMGTQQLSEARAGSFLLMGYAGNSAPDHVDQLHSLPEYLSMM